MMKLVFAVIRPHRVDEVLRELTARGVAGATVIEVEGYGRQLGHDELYKGTEYKVALKPKRGLLVAVLDEEVERVKQAIRKAASTGGVGDGKIFVLPLEEVLRIRTGETGEEAI